MADMTRYEFSLVLARNLDLVGNDATGADAMEALVEAGILRSADDGGGLVTREMAATMFARAAGLEAGDSLGEGMAAALKAGLFTSEGDPTQAFDSEWFDDVFQRGIDKGMFEATDVVHGGEGSIVGLDDIRDFRGFDKVLRERFPSQAWMLDHPELGPIIVKAVQEEWDEDVLFGQISASGWGKDRTDAQEAWDTLEGSNPEEAQRQVKVEIDDLVSRAATVGATLPAGFLDDLARRSLRSNMTDKEIVGEILEAATNFEAGSFTANQTYAKASAASMMLTMSDADAEDTARRMLLGEIDEAGVSQEMRERAKSKFPSLAELIGSGTNLANYFSDHKATIARLMGRDADAIDLVNDPQWAAVLGFAAEPGSTPRPMAVHEVERFVRTKDDYYRTATGRAELSRNRLRLQSALGLR